MPRSWVVFLVLVASACGDSTTNEDVADPADSATSPIEATTAGTTTPPPAVSSGVAPTDVPSVAPTDVPGVVEPSVVPEGFVTIAARVTASDGEICELCLWLAADAATRGRGLMQVTDLGGLDGMAFRYEDPHTTSFTMRNTVMPLSIAFFGADGAHLDSFDMEPCVVEPCASYPTPAAFMVAIEVPQGGLAELGIGTGSTLELLAEACA